MVQQRSYKKCAACEKRKPPEDFHKSRNRKDGRHSYCKPCTRRKNAEWVAANKATHAATCANWYRRNKARANASASAWHYKRYYGMTKADLTAMFLAANGSCQVCALPLRLEGRVGGNKAVVDHDHDTGKVRGMLCAACNMGLGSFRDSQERLAAAAEYLTRGQK